MSKIRSAFENGKAFIPFITCGDPNLETTAKIVREAVANGADLIELGIPFSDPTAEGPVIQSANIKALEAAYLQPRYISILCFKPLSVLSPSKRPSSFELAIYINELISIQPFASFS